MPCCALQTMYIEMVVRTQRILYAIMYFTMFGTKSWGAFFKTKGPLIP